MEANLRLRGTVGNPALLGRVNITQGQVVFFGTRYSIDQGSISFFNPLGVEPVLNIDLETKARGIDVTLNVSGPLNKLGLTPRPIRRCNSAKSWRCWPPAGRPPSDPALLAQQTGRRSPGSRWARRRCWARPSPAP